MTTNPVAQQIGPNQTFGAHISINAFLRPLPTPLYDTEVPAAPGTLNELKFFSGGVSYNYESIQRSRTRSVLKLFEKGLVRKSVITEHHDKWSMERTPKEVMDGYTFSGDVIVGLDSTKKPRRALVLCHNERLAGRAGGREINPTQDGLIILWDEGKHWGRRFKVLNFANIREAYEKIGPEVCMALAARASKHPEIRMAGEASKITI
jgi:hypothetical protein